MPELDADPAPEIRESASFPGRLAARILHIRPGEGHRTAILFLQLFASSGIFILGRTVHDTLFLSRYSIAALPWMFVLYGIGAAVVSLFYGRYADRIARPSLLYATCFTAIVTYIAVWMMVRAAISLVYPIFYVWSEIVSNLLILQFWTLASEFDRPREARRLNAAIGSARPLGTILFGAGASLVVSKIGTAQLILALVALIAIVALCVRALKDQPRLNIAAESRPRAGGAEHLISAPERSYFRSLSALMLIMFLALTLGDYQFKMIARASYTEDALAEFFSLFYCVTGILSVCFQIFLTPLVLSRLGVGTALTVLPGVFGTSSMMLLFWPGLPAACSLKFADNGLQFTLHDTTMQSLYSPFSAAARGRTRAFLDGAIKPLSYAAGGLLLVLLLHTRLDVRGISFVTVPLALAWQALIPLVRRGYLGLLERGLAGPAAARMFAEPFVIGYAERRLLIHTIETGDSHASLVALEQLKEDRSADFRGAVLGLLNRRDGALRSRAIQVLDSLEETSAIPEFARAARDDDPLVRAAAVAALARCLADDNPGLVLPFLDDPSSDVRGEALASLLRYGGLECATKAGDRLLDLIASENPEQRREACSVLSRLGHAACLPIRKLLQDPNASVRRAAMRAAAGAADVNLVPALVGGLFDAAVSKTSLSALIAVGEPAVPFIEQAMREPTLPRAVRLQLPRVLSRIPSMKSFAVLRQFEADTDSHFRLRVFAALGRLRSALGYAPTPSKLILPLVRREAIEVWGNLDAWNRGRERFGTVLLVEEMDFRKKRAERRMLRLLEMSYDRREIGLVIVALQDQERREEALDALEALVAAPLRELVIPTIESLGPGAAALPVDSITLSALPSKEFMLLQAYHPNPYVNFLALDALAQAGEQSAVPAAQSALHHPDPLVREAGLHALARLSPENAGAQATPLRIDPDTAVAGWARHYSVAVAGGAPSLSSNSTENPMYSTIEKILLLKRTPLFSRLSGEDLAPLARVAEVIQLSEGDYVFREGDAAEHFYVAIRGLILLESQDTELRRVAPPGMIGELAVLDRGAQSCSARALQASELLRIGADEFFEVLHEQTEIAETLIQILAGEVREAQRSLVQRSRSSGGVQTSPPECRDAT